MHYEFTMAPPATVRGNVRVRASLLEFFIDCCSSSELSDWLTALGRLGDGSAADKRRRLRQASTFLTVDPGRLPRAVLSFVLKYGDERLAALCETLRLPAEGTVDAKARRVLRHVGHAEGWLPPVDATVEEPRSLEEVRPFLDFHFVGRRGQETADLARPLAGELGEIFGDDCVRVDETRATGTDGPVPTVRVGRQAPWHLPLLRPGQPVELTRQLAVWRAPGAAPRPDVCVVVLTDRLPKTEPNAVRQLLAQAGVAGVIK